MKHHLFRIADCEKFKICENLKIAIFILFSLTIVELIFWRSGSSSDRLDWHRMAWAEKDIQINENLTNTCAHATRRRAPQPRPHLETYLESIFGAETRCKQNFNTKCLANRKDFKISMLETLLFFDRKWSMSPICPYTYDPR